jgi:hypothetical protein
MSADSVAWSPLLIQQLPHDPSPHSMKQMDDLKLPLRVIKAGLYQADQAGISNSAGMKILEICKDLLSLVSHLSHSPSSSSLSTSSSLLEIVACPGI